MHKSLHTIPDLQTVTIDPSVNLVPLRGEHGQLILTILDQDPAIRQSVTVASRLRSQEDIQKEILRYRSDTGLLRYTITENNEPIGMISFWRDDGFWGEKNLDDYGFGYFLSKRRRGKGIIHRSIQELMKIARKRLYIRQFVAFCEDGNSASKAVLEKLGFQPTQETKIEPSKGWIERKYILK